jgi:hypothetical protein
MKINYIVNGVVSIGARIIKFKRPSSEDQNTAHFLEQLTDNGEYINK